MIWSERFFALVFFFVEAGISIWGGVIDLNLFRQIWLLATSSNFCIRFRVVGALMGLKLWFDSAIEDTLLYFNDLNRRKFELLKWIIFRLRTFSSHFVVIIELALLLFTNPKTPKPLIHLYSIKNRKYMLCPNYGHFLNILYRIKPNQAVSTNQRGILT